MTTDWTRTAIVVGAVLIGYGAQYATLNSKVEALEVTVLDLKGDAKAQKEDLIALKVDVAVTKNTVGRIEDKLDKAIGAKYGTE